MSIGLIAGVVCAYLLVIAYLAYRGFQATRTAGDYLIAGRRVNPYVMALSYGATFISTSAIVGFGGAAAVFGMGILWLTFLNIFFGIFIAFIFFGKRTRKMGHNLDAHTFPEFLGKRFQSRFLQAAGGLLIFVAMPLYAGSVMIGGAQFLAPVLNISYETALMGFAVIVAVYVIMGGLKGVMYTDAFQGTIMFLGMAVLLVFTYVSLGGITGAHRALTALAPEAVGIFGALGHRGWTSMPEIGSRFWLELVTTIVLGVGIGVLAQPQLVVRFMTVKSDRELNRALLIGGVFILMMTGVAFVVGALTNVYFFQHPDFGTVSIVASQRTVEQILPLYISSALPAWFTVLFMITLLAAAMSTLSSQFHNMGTAIGRDVYEKGFKITSGNSTYISRAGIAFAILISLSVAWSLPRFLEHGSAIVAIGTAIFFGLCAAAFLPMYYGALYSRRITRAGAVACLLSGSMVSVFWLFFVNVKTSTPVGLCRLFFGVNTLAGESRWQFVDPLVVSLPVSIIFTAAISRLTRPPEKRHLEKCFRGVGRTRPAKAPGKG